MNPVGILHNVATTAAKYKVNHVYNDVVFAATAPAPPVLEWQYRRIMPEFGVAGVTRTYYSDDLLQTFVVCADSAGNTAVFEKDIFELFPRA